MLKEATETHSRKPRPWRMLGTEDPVLWVCWFVFNTTGVWGVVTCFWLCCVLVAALALLELQCVGAPPRCSTRAPHRTWLLGCSTGSGCAGLSSCSMQSQQLWLLGSRAQAHGLSWSEASGIFLDQGSNLCLLHWRWILYHWATREASVFSLSFHKIPSYSNTC